MKIEYKLEMSEGEYLGMINMIGNTLAGVIEAAKAPRRVSSMESALREAGFERVAEDEGDADSDTDEDPEDSGTEEQEPYWSGYGPEHVVFDDRYGSDRPEGEHVARGETDSRGVETPEEEPLPRVAAVRGVDMDKGRKAFEKLLRLWLKNFGVEGADQPDRAEAMRALANSPRSFKVLAYVKAQGGLTHAVNALAPYLTEMDEDVYKKLVLDVAGNITQVASLLFPDLSDLYEFKDIFRSADDEEDEDDE
jgi:hypothetical protein